ncbi:MAG: hypothetical protein KKG10_04635 [Proteobacteria bacterium]|nr:hypothetical protein [Pseudomonadota bacterium]
MKRLIMILMVIATLTIAGCSGNNVKELFETAQLEEQQNNRDYALKIYREIVEKNPKSEYAAKARKRLAALQQQKN